MAPISPGSVLRSPPALLARSLVMMKASLQENRVYEMTSSSLDMSDFEFIVYYVTVGSVDSSESKLRPRPPPHLSPQPCGHTVSTLRGQVTL